GMYGIENLKRVVNNLMEWTYKPGEGYDNLDELYDGVIRQFDYYVGHVLRNIGGVYETPKLASQPGAVYEAVPSDVQKNAIVFLDTQLFTPPTWLLDPAILARTGDSPTQIASRMQDRALNY